MRQSVKYVCTCLAAPVLYFCADVHQMSPTSVLHRDPHRRSCLSRAQVRTRVDYRTCTCSVSLNLTPRMIV